MNLTRSRAVSLLLCTADPLPPEDHPEWTALAEMLETDAELAAWFASQSAADDLLVRSLDEREPLTPFPEVAKSMVPAPAVTAPSILAPTRRAVLGSAAAALAIGSAGLWYTLSRPTAYLHATTTRDFSGFREDMAIFANGYYRLSVKDANMGNLITWLRDQGASAPDSSAVLPATITAVAESGAKGCKVIPWGKSKVGLICFYHPENRAIIHMMTVPTSELAGNLPPASEMAQEVLLHGQRCIAFATEHHLHILVADPDSGPLAKLLV